MPDALRCLLPFLAVAFLAPPALASTGNPDVRASDLTAYASGRLALAWSDPEAARRYLAPITGKDAASLPLRRALEAAILGGNPREAEKLALQIPLTPSRMDEMRSGFIIALTRAATAAGRGDWKAYNRSIGLIAAAEGPAPSETLGSILKAYGLAGRGKLAEALATLDSTAASKGPRPQLLEHRAILLGLAKRWGEAADTYAELVQGAGRDSPTLRLAAASAMLEAASAGAPPYRERAILLLGEGAANDPLLVEARRKLTADPKVTSLGGLPASAAEGLGTFLLQMASDLARGQALDPAVALGRLSTFAAPKLGAPWIATAEFLARSGQTSLALDALSRVPKAAPWPQVAETQRILILGKSGQYDEARRLATRRLQRQGARRSDYLLLFDVERQAKDRAAAARALTGALDVDDTANPLASDEKAYLHFLRGAMLERLGNWPAARADLEQAVTLDDSNPAYLNYLGYSLLDRSIDMPEAQRLITAAYEAAPENGAIIDSMGWVDYKSGRYASAVTLLEQAFAAEPTDPNVADHLGDALWQMGRRFEARHAWNSALAFVEEDDALRKTLELKQAFGPGVLAGVAGRQP